ncbi:hypothetical protein TREES_T100004892 [Tupaia chinensis]|uniref:Uncharacterized protein n=1 Tax=Tupaia chinensis TaxID=246437 RepID=L9LDN1_TUPCH|nr:hypothetical protein TREES_T100004892 [Tupaia chinensis]
MPKQLPKVFCSYGAWKNLKRSTFACDKKRKDDSGGWKVTKGQKDQAPAQACWQPTFPDFGEQEEEIVFNLSMSCRETGYCRAKSTKGKSSKQTVVLQTEFSDNRVATSGFQIYTRCQSAGGDCSHQGSHGNEMRNAVVALGLVQACSEKAQTLAGDSDDQCCGAGRTREGLRGTP